MKLLILDGNSILNRAFYGIRLLTTKDGFFTNAIYGFLTMFEKLKEDVNPDAVAIAFDLKAPTFRHKQYEGYKASRKGMPDELAVQLPVLKELLGYLGYRIVECEGYEADDILGTLAKACEDSGNNAVIATGDRDALQLVGENVTVRLMSTKMGRPVVTVFDEAQVEQVYNVKPRQLIDIKAIQGDASDNIPGVRGIGQKGACDLISKYSSVDYIYDHLDELEITPSMRNKLEQSRDLAFLSYKLGEIVKNAPVDTKIENYVRNPINKQAATRLMAKLEFFSLLEKMNLNTEQETPQEIKTAPKTLVYVEEISELDEAIRDLDEVSFLCDYEGEMIKALALTEGDNIYLLRSRELIKHLLSKPLRFNTHDLKTLYSSGLRPKIDFDCMLAAYLINPSSSDYRVSRLNEEYNCSANIEGECGEFEFLVKNTAALPELCNILKTRISENNQESLLKDIEMDLAVVLESMENLGFCVDRSGIELYRQKLETTIKTLQEEIYSLAGHEFNINSPKQLGVVLFEEMGLPSGKRTKTGYSTNAAVLENLRYDYPIVENILSYRTLAKLKSTYCDGLLKVIGNDGRVHTRFNQTEARTGRISSLEPNLQNIPVRTDIGRELRRFFITKPSHVLVDADYSQIELRVLAHISDDPIMISAFNNGDDIHTITASQVFHMPSGMVTPLMRTRAKAVNFGIVYGIGAFSLSKSLDISRKEAALYIEKYLEKYRGVSDYMDRIVKKAKDDGYVTTMFERRRYLPELTSSNSNLRSFGERVARNMPIQGTAADIIKIAMIRVYHRLNKEGLNARLILQIHDELIVEAPEDEAGKVAQILTHEMENVVNLKVPLVAKAAIGKTWYSAKG